MRVSDTTKTIIQAGTVTGLSRDAYVVAYEVVGVEGNVIVLRLTYDELRGMIRFADPDFE